MGGQQQTFHFSFDILSGECINNALRYSAINSPSKSSLWSNDYTAGIRLQTAPKKEAAPILIPPFKTKLRCFLLICISYQIQNQIIHIYSIL